MELFDVRLIGVNAETGRKLLLTVAFLLAILGMRAAIVGLAHLSIWFDDPLRGDRARQHVHGGRHH
jgi:hypothetical protein